MFLNFLKPESCALLVVDPQQQLMRVINESERVTRNTALLMKTAKTLDIPIIATTQYAKRIGELMPEVQMELNGVVPMDKMEFSCFNNSAIKEKVQSLKPQVDTLIVCGVETHICIYQTVLGALQADFAVWVPADAVSSRTTANYETGLQRIREIGGVIANTELVIYELLQKAGTPEFKEMLPHLK